MKTHELQQILRDLTNNSKKKKKDSVLEDWCTLDFSYCFSFISFGIEPVKCEDQWLTISACADTFRLGSRESDPHNLAAEKNE